MSVRYSISIRPRFTGTTGVLVGFYVMASGFIGITSKYPQRFAVYFVDACPLPLPEFTENILSRGLKNFSEVKKLRQIKGQTKPSKRFQKLININKQCKYGMNFGVQDQRGAGDTC